MSKNVSYSILLFRCICAEHLMTSVVQYLPMLSEYCVYRSRET